MLPLRLISTRTGIPRRFATRDCPLRVWRSTVRSVSRLDSGQSCPPVGCVLARDVCAADQPAGADGTVAIEETTSIGMRAGQGCAPGARWLISYVLNDSPMNGQFCYGLEPASAPPPCTDDLVAVAWRCWSGHRSIQANWGCLAPPEPTRPPAAGPDA